MERCSLAGFLAESRPTAAKVHDQQEPQSGEGGLVKQGRGMYNFLGEQE